MNGFGVGDNGRFLKSTDAGVSWTVSFVPTGSNLYGIYFLHALRGHVVGLDGVVFRTNDGGMTWTSQSSGTVERLESVFFTSDNTGYAVGREDTYLSTADGGATWTSSILLGNDRELNEVFFLDANNGYMAGNAGLIQVSSDGGALWTTQASGTVQDLEDIHFATAGAGDAAGASGAATLWNAVVTCSVAPTGLNSVPSLVSGVVFRWTALAGAEQYQLQGGPVAGGTNRLLAPTNALNVANAFFTPATSYNWRVRARCGADVSPWSALAAFTMPTLRKVVTSADVLVFPNPSSTQVNVRFPEMMSELVVLAADGQRMLLDLAPANAYSFDVSRWPAGIYLLRANTGQDVVTQTLTVGF